MLRASDFDREQIAERLRNATAEGRLLASELEERLTTAFSARTYGELDALVADLPVARDRKVKRPPVLVRAGLALAVAMAVLAVLAMVTLVLLGIAGAWLAWMVFAWMFFGRGRWSRCAGYSRSGRAAYVRRVNRTRSPRSDSIAL